MVINRFASFLSLNKKKEARFCIHTMSFVKHHGQQWGWWWNTMPVDLLVGLSMPVLFAMDQPDSQPMWPVYLLLVGGCVCGGLLRMWRPHLPHFRVAKLAVFVYCLQTVFFRQLFKVDQDFTAQFAVAPLVAMTCINIHSRHHFDWASYIAGVLVLATFISAAVTWDHHRTAFSGVNHNHENSLPVPLPPWLSVFVGFFFGMEACYLSAAVLPVLVATDFVFSRGFTQHLLWYADSTWYIVVQGVLLLFVCTSLLYRVQLEIRRAWWQQEHSIVTPAEQRDADKHQQHIKDGGFPETPRPPAAAADTLCCSPSIPSAFFFSYIAGQAILVGISYTYTQYSYYFAACCYVFLAFDITIKLLML